MPVVEVSCPHCGAKLKAPENMAGKKAKCKKCQTGFRVPGPTPAADSAGDGPALSAMAMPTQPPPAGPADVARAAAAAAPPKNLSPLPSTDPFDFGKSAKPQPASGAVPAAAPKSPPAPVKSAPKADPEPLTIDPEPLTIDDEPVTVEARLPDNSSPAQAKSAPPAQTPNATADNPFSFSTDAPPAKSKRQKDEDDEEERPKKKKKSDDEDDRPTKSKRRKDDDEDEERPRKKKKSDDEDDRPTKSKRRDDEEDERPKKKKKSDDEPEDEVFKLPVAIPAAVPVAPVPVAAGDNPFSFTGLADAPSDDRPAKSKRRDDDDERPKKKKKSEDDENDRPTKSKRRNDDDDDDRPKKKRSGDDEDDDGTKPRYRRPAEAGGTRKTLLITGVIGAIALGLGIAAVIAYVSKNKPEPEQTKKDEKKDEPAAGTTDSAAKGDPKSKDKESKDKNPKKPKDSDPKPLPDPESPAPGKLSAFALPKGVKTFSVGPLPAKPTLTDKAQNEPVELDVPLANVRRVFPPFDAKTGDTCVLVQVAPAAGGKTEVLALESYGPARNRIPEARIEYRGEDLNVPVPIADLHASTAGVFFLAAVGGKLHVWSLSDKPTKIADGLSPYADKPEHAKAGLAAAFFTPDDPNQIVTVSTAGAVMLYDLRTKKPVPMAEFIPPDGAPGKVALGKSVAKAVGNGSVVLAVGGWLYQVEAKPGLDRVRKHNLGGEVGRSIALAASGTPGRLLYVFETQPDRSGKKDTAVLALPLGEEANPISYLFPSAAAGEPKGALWVSDDIGGVVTDRGVVWFDDRDGKFLPLVNTQPASTGLYFGDDKNFWYVIPHPTMPNKSALVAVTGDFNDRAEYLKSFPSQPLRTLRIDASGLSK